MTLKSQIRKAINENTKYTYIKMYKPEIRTFDDGSATILIEVDIKSKPK
jgi:hypothetical protein